MFSQKSTGTVVIERFEPILHSWSLTCHFPLNMNVNTGHCTVKNHQKNQRKLIKTEFWGIKKMRVRLGVRVTFG